MHLLPQLDWANLRLAFEKLKLFTNEMMLLGIKYQVGKKIGILDQQIEKIPCWPTCKNQVEVREFLGIIGITK